MTNTLSAQSPAMELQERPPYLDPPDNTQIGVGAFEYTQPHEPYPGPRHPDVRYLNQSYDLFIRAGYKKPPLSPKINYSNGDSRIAAFRYDLRNNPSKGEYTGTELGAYITELDCEKMNVSTPISKYSVKNWIVLNSNTKSNTAAELKQTFSHELFHAFQDGYPLFEYDCVKAVGTPPGWITEGLADAAANIMARQAVSLEWSKLKKGSYLGIRSYRLAFQDREHWKKPESGLSNIMSHYLRKGNSISDEAFMDYMEYATSSFWEFLARRSTGLLVDYSVRADIATLLATWIPLLEHRPQGAVNQNTGWLKLVNDYVNKHLDLQNKLPKGEIKGKALYGWLPEFFTEYATWWEKRNSQVSDDPEKWLNRAYGGCEKISLKPGRTGKSSSQKTILTDFSKNSARCLQVKLSGFTGPVNIKIRAEYKDSLRGDQLHLGLARVEAPSGSGKTIESCWDHNVGNRLSCRRVGKVSMSPPHKTWKTDQYSTKTLKLPDGPIDTTITYVISNVTLDVPYTADIKKVTLTTSASYVYGGDKNFAPPNSIRPADVKNLSQISSGSNKKQIFYRLYTSPPAGLPGLFNIELNQIEDGEQPRCGGDDKNTYCAYDTGGDYYIKPGPNVSFGQTGRITATVHKNPDNGPALLSTYCSADADQKAVEILDSGDDGVVLRVNTDLCEVPGHHNDYCNKQPFCPVRDHLLTTLTLGLGREHFAETAPVHELTPGTQFDMDLYYRYGVPTESSSSSSQSGSSSSSGSASGSGSAGDGTSAPGNSAGSGGSLGNCSCSCDERENTLRQAEELKAREAAGENIPGTAFMDLMACASSCQNEYMICELEKNRKARETREAKRQPAADTACDCSCTALDGLESRTQSLLKKFQSGDQSALAEMQTLGQCMSVCQNELMNCHKSK